MGITLQIQCSENIYLRDPLSSDLGRRIVSEAIHLIDELGFEGFTFRKLAQRIQSTEASIYRYFENKHKLLVYLTSWFWAWMEYMIDYRTNNITNPKEQLDIIIHEMTSLSKRDDTISHVDEQVLHRIVVSESTKAYLTKQVDDEMKMGYFSNYRSLCERIASIIKEINPEYPYPLTMASNLIETAHEQTFFAIHLPYLTDITYSSEKNEKVRAFLKHLVEQTIFSQ